MLFRSSEHADVGFGHVRQRGVLNVLATAPRAFDDGHGRFGAAVAQEDALRLHDLARAAAAFGVVERGDEIGRCRRFQPAGNGGLGREQIYFYINWILW